MKKLFRVLTLGVACALLAGCANNGSSAKDGGSKDEGYSTTVLKDADYDAYTVAGPFASNVEGKAVDWKYTEQGEMKATSLAELAKISEPMAKTLKDKKLKGLYVYEGALIGCTQVGHAGWNADAMKNGEKIQLDGGYCVKAIACTLDDLTGGYLATQWIQDPHTACVENLTPDTYFVPVWQEAADENGFAWNSNPVCIGGAGKYTIVVASYDATVDETKVDSYNFAMGLIKTEAKEEFVPAEHDHYRLVGSINGWNKDDTAEAVQFSAEGVLSYTFAADDEFKVISALTDGTGSWDGAFGFSAESLGEGVEATDFVDAGGNFKVVTAGTYRLSVADGALTISRSVA